jgi:hypothetical protein
MTYPHPRLLLFVAPRTFGRHRNQIFRGSGLLPNPGGTLFARFVAASAAYEFLRIRE